MKENNPKLDLMKSSPIQEAVKFENQPLIDLAIDKDTGDFYTEKDLEHEVSRQNIGVERFVSLISKGILHTSDILEKNGKYYSRHNFSVDGGVEVSKEGEMEAEMFLLEYLFGDNDHGFGSHYRGDLNFDRASDGRFSHYDYSDAFRDTIHTAFAFSKNEDYTQFKKYIIYLLEHTDRIGKINYLDSDFETDMKFGGLYKKHVDQNVENVLLLKTNAFTDAISDRTIEQSIKVIRKDFFHTVIERANLNLTDERFSFLSATNQEGKVEEFRKILLNRLETLKSILLERKK